jgi:PH domain/WW domain
VLLFYFSLRSSVWHQQQSGPLKVPGGFKWKDHHVVVKEDKTVTWFKTASAVKPVKSFSLGSGTPVIEEETKIKNMTNVIHILAAGKHFNFQAANPEEMREWMDVFESVRDGREVGSGGGGGGSNSSNSGFGGADSGGGSSGGSMDMRSSADSAAPPPRFNPPPRIAATTVSAGSSPQNSRECLACGALMTKAFCSQCGADSEGNNPRDASPVVSRPPMAPRPAPRVPPAVPGIGSGSGSGIGSGSGMGGSGGPPRAPPMPGRVGGPGRIAPAIPSRTPMAPPRRPPPAVASFPSSASSSSDYSDDPGALPSARTASAPSTAAAAAMRPVRAGRIPPRIPGGGGGRAGPPGGRVGGPLAQRMGPPGRRGVAGMGFSAPQQQQQSWQQQQQQDSSNAQEAPEQPSDAHVDNRRRSLSVGSMQEAIAEAARGPKAPTGPPPSSALPPFWEEHTDAGGNIYFWNSQTDESSWTRPALPARGPRPPPGPAPPGVARSAPASAEVMPPVQTTTMQTTAMQRSAPPPLRQRSAPPPAVRTPAGFGVARSASRPPAALPSGFGSQPPPQTAPFPPSVGEMGGRTMIPIQRDHDHDSDAPLPPDSNSSVIDGPALSTFSNAVRRGPVAGSLARTGHQSISIPGAVAHIGSFSDADFSWAFEGDGSKRGFLERQAGASWKRTFCIMRKGQLCEFPTETATTPSHTIDLRDTKIDKNFKGSKKDYAFQISDKGKGKTHVYACPDASEHGQWTTACLIGGAVDATLSVQTVTTVNRPGMQARNRQNVVAAATAEKPLFEEVAPRSKAQQDVQDFRRRQREVSQLAREVDPVTAEVYLGVVGYEVVNDRKNKPDYVMYEIEVQFALASWSVQRRWGQVEMVDRVLKMQREMTDYPRGGFLTLKAIKGIGKFSQENIDMRKSHLDEFLAFLLTVRHNIFASKVASSHFVRFICPVQMGDKKPAGLVLPFKVSDYNY